MNASTRRQTPYVFHGQTSSLCSECLTLVPAKILVEDGQVFYQKRCRTHGTSRVLVSTDAAYWRLCHDYLKPGDRPLVHQTRTERGCPYDCGLCPDHEQHSCLALIDAMAVAIAGSWAIAACCTVLFALTLRLQRRIAGS
jgi:uncharacterized radical SAM superfamily Fe-S cluster-containing enzyme